MAHDSLLRHHRRAKIVATLGPASSSPQRLEQCVQAGVDVFRLNFSHGTHADHAARIGMIRELETRLGRSIGILADVQGPKLRVGCFADGKAHLASDALLRLDLDPTPGDATRVQLPHPEILAAAVPGTVLLLDDGKLRLEVEEQHADHLLTRVQVGGVLSDHKGVNVPGIVLPIPALTEKDRADLAFVLELGVDYIGLSFVQRPEDVEQARTLVAGRAAILTKLEKPQALEQLDDILRLSDAVMVARGDLGVELPPEDVPQAQKRIIRAARHWGRPVVVATQMLESMILAPTPTRAEASDVAGAVYDGADAVMLSAETAAGAYPVEAVSIMDRIIARVEQDEGWRQGLQASRPAPQERSSGALATAARQISEVIHARAIVAMTISGDTALRVARERPVCPVLGLTPHAHTARRLSLAWGVEPVVTPDIHSMTQAVEQAMQVVRLRALAQSNDEIVLVAGVPFGKTGSTNALRIAQLP